MSEPEDSLALESAKMRCVCEKSETSKLDARRCRKCGGMIRPLTHC